jgi:nicotinamide mononucleotide transporter
VEKVSESNAVTIRRLIERIESTADWPIGKLRTPKMRRFVTITAILLSTAAVAAARLGWVPFSATETLGFVTGAACVYLVIEQNLWNFPIGIANNIIFLVLFIMARLYGDASLQIVYLVLAIHGWYSWLWGGKEHSELKIERASIETLTISVLATIAATFVLMRLLRLAGGSVPLLDGLTTALSLVAQYLLNRKLIQNWYFWMLADVIYVYVYIIKHLYLTGILYAIFFGMCVAGYLVWLKALNSDSDSMTRAFEV